MMAELAAWGFGALAMLVPILASTLRIASPLILCAMGGLFSERAGIVDIGLEGKLLAAAFAAAVAASVAGSAWVGLGAGILTAMLLALLHGFACITQRGNQVVSGVAINLLVSGLTALLGIAWFQRGGQTPALPPAARFLPVAALGGQDLLVLAALLAVPATGWVIGATRFGLRLRAVGELPRAVDAAGISVAWLRYRALLICGLLTGIAGSYLSIAQNAGFSRDMSGGQGYIALAALIVGKWRPLPALGACLGFGLLDALAIRLQGVRLGGLGTVPVEAIQVLPYALTVILLAGFVGRAVAPKALGVPYDPAR
jgi:ABC-type uncharacterized transport system permease subunit